MTPQDAAHLPPLIQQMLRSEFYPNPPTGPIQLIQTHISYVLLTGDYAYKIKKPVDLKFVDFSSLDRRRHFCEEEVRLNRRGAPDIYLQVVSITSEPQGFRFDGPGPVAEYAVKMRQFPQDSLFSNMLAQNQIGIVEAETLGIVLAGYHAATATNASISSFGDPKRIAETVEGNYRQTERFVGNLLTREQFDQIKAFTTRFLADFEPELNKRIREGRIRECHGDLHLRNICAWKGKLHLFDCIEFNDAFRNVDVMHDAAFPAMELTAAGREDLSVHFLNAYLERTGDWEGAQLLPLYLCRQAYVRAKVNSLLQEEEEISASDRQAAQRAARDYYKLACSYAAPRPRGNLTVVCGMSGSGKTTVARRLAAEMRAIHIRSDALRKHIASVPLDARGDASLYTPEMSARTYSRLAGLGVLLAGRGFDVVLDATYDRRSRRAEVRELAARNGIKLEFVFCDAPLPLRRQRVLARRGDVSDATADLLDRQQAEFETFDAVELRITRTIDTTAAQSDERAKGPIWARARDDRSSDG